MDGQTDGRTDGRMDGRRTDGREKKIWGRSLQAFLTKNHPNRSYPRPLLAIFRIAEGASRGGSGWGREPPPPGNAMLGKETQFMV